MHAHLRAVVISCHSIELAWTNDPRTVHIQVIRREQSGLPTLIVDLRGNPPPTMFLDSSVHERSTYTYTVAQWDQQGNLLDTEQSAPVTTPSCGSTA